MVDVVEGMSNEEYQAVPALSSSEIKIMAVSMKALKAHRVSKEPPDIFARSRKALNFGSLYHELCQDIDAFIRMAAIIPGKISKDDLATLKNSIINNKQLPLTVSEFRDMMGMYYELQNSNMAQGLFASLGMVEVSIFWDDPVFGFPCKCRPDRLFESYQIQPLDIKSAASASYEKFRHSCGEFKYHWQCWWYLRGIHEALKKAYGKYNLLVQEKVSPYDIAFYEIGEKELWAAGQRIAPLLEQYAKALETDRWEGYPEIIQPLKLKSFHL